MGVLGAYSKRTETARRICPLLKNARSQRIERTPRQASLPTKPKTTPVELQQAIAADDRSGAGIKEIAQKYDVHRVTVRTCLDRISVELRPKGLTAAQIDAAEHLYETERLSLATIGERFGVTSRTVHLPLLERGVAMRDIHGRPRIT